MRWLVFLLAYVLALTVCFAIFFHANKYDKNVCTLCLHVHVPTSL